MGNSILVPNGATTTGPWGQSNDYIFSLSSPVYSSSYYPFGSLIGSWTNYSKAPLYTLLYFYHDFDLYGTTTFTPTITATSSNQGLVSVKLGWSPSKDASYVANGTTAPAGVSFTSASITGKVFDETSNYWGVWVQATPLDTGYGYFTLSLNVTASLTIVP